MTIKSSGPLSLSEIAAEYGWTPPFSLTMGYGQPGLPTSGPISIANFYGKTAAGGGGGGFSASVSSDANGSRLGAGSATTNVVTASPGGGTFPYSYAWSRVSGDVFTITAAASASTAFSAAVSVAQTKSGLYCCIITDSLGATGTAYCTVTITETT